MLRSNKQKPMMRKLRPILRKMRLKSWPKLVRLPWKRHFLL